MIDEYDEEVSKRKNERPLKKEPPKVTYEK
jgi:hypothetical protein